MACAAIYGVYVLMVDSVSYILLIVAMLYYVVNCVLFIHPIYFECYFHFLLFLSVFFIFYTTLYRHIIHYCIIHISGKRNARDNDLHRGVSSSALGKLLLSYLSK